MSSTSSCTRDCHGLLGNAVLCNRMDFQYQKELEKIRGLLKSSSMVVLSLGTTVI